MAMALPSATAGDAQAERPAGVVELFTSQGCASCPPADELFGKLAAEGDVVALAYHVDYWDYLGWKDTLGTHQNTERQRAYAGSFDRTVYTPQVVVNGNRDIIGSHGAAIHSALKESAGTAEGLTVDVDISETEDSIVIEAGAAADDSAEARVILANFVPRRLVQMERGENRGRAIEYRNSVTNFQFVGMWHGKATRYELPRSVLFNAGGCAVLLQVFDERGHPGAILGAAMLERHDEDGR